MSMCKKIGKDKVIFATKEDHQIPSTVKLPEPEPSPGLILPSGEINWNCPCLGGMATGPCGVQFREAFSCFHYSQEEPKGAECYEAFKSMQSCMANYPTLYSKDDDDSDDDYNNREDPLESISKASVGGDNKVDQKSSIHGSPLASKDT